MKIVPSGHFESGLVRFHDELVSPARNNTPHPYYIDLNRKTDRLYRDGAATFVGIAETVVVPWELDWNESEPAKRLGISRSQYGKRDPLWQKHNEEVEALLKLISERNPLSAQSMMHICSLRLGGYGDDVINTFDPSDKKRMSDLISAYLRRFLHQIHSANRPETFLLVSEPELGIIKDLGVFISSNPENTYPFPDLTTSTINPETFVEGVLNFSPKDMESLIAVRENDEIQGYARRINEEIKKEEISGITRAAMEAYYKTEAGRKSKEVFEVMSWVVKPLHYVPGADAVLSALEDLKDGALKVAEWKNRYNDWHLLGVKMQMVSTEDFFRRMDNRFPEMKPR